MPNVKHTNSGITIHIPGNAAVTHVQLMHSIIGTLQGKNDTDTTAPLLQLLSLLLPDEEEVEKCFANYQ